MREKSRTHKQFGQIPRTRPPRDSLETGVSAYKIVSVATKFVMKTQNSTPRFFFEF
jgi:hypothetical protein